MDRIRHVLRRGIGTEVSATKVGKARHAGTMMQELCGPREPSASQSYRNADQRQTDRDRRKARGPRSKPGATPKRISAHEQHSDGNSVGEAQRQSRVADENERNDERERRQEAEQADAHRAAARRALSVADARARAIGAVFAASIPAGPAARPTPARVATRPR